MPYAASTCSRVRSRRGGEGGPCRKSATAMTAPFSAFSFALQNREKGGQGGRKSASGFIA